MGLTRFAAAAAALLSLVLASAPLAHAQSAPSASRPAPAKAELRESFRMAPQEAPAVEIEMAAPPAAEWEKLRKINSAGFTKRLEIGIGREMSEAIVSRSELAWKAVGGGMAAHFKVTSKDAKALRIALNIERMAPGTQIRFWSVGDGVIYGPVTVRELLATGPELWSPVLEGETAFVEIFVPKAETAGQTRIGVARVSHLFVSPSDPMAEQLAKVAGPCEVDAICRTASDAQLALVSRSVARMTFGASGTALCTGSLLNSTDGSFTPYFYSAAHCISSQSTASTLNTHWFYERTTCGGSTLSPSYVQVGGGSTMLFANTSTDVFFARLNSSPPASAIFSGWDAATLSGGALTAVHHPDGDVKKVSLGTFGGLGPASGLGPSGSFIRVNWNSIATGVTEPGSSGGGIWSGNSSAGYLFRGGLLGGPSSCSASSSDLYDYYSRFDQAYSQLSQYLSPGPTLPEGPNILANPGFESGPTGWSQQSSSGLSIITNDAANARSGSWYAYMGGRDSLTESLTQDFVVPSTQARLSFYYRIDTQETLAAEFDVLTVSLVNPSTGAVLTNLLTLSNRTTTSGYAQTSNLDISAFAGQTVRLRFSLTTDSSLLTNFRIDDVSVRGAQTSGSTNYTALWWNQNESGWGINVTQQGDIAFATLFTYDSAGAPLWLVMSNGARQGSSDTFSGPLYRTTGPVFNANPFTPIGAGNVTQVGTMTIAFSGSSGTLTYTFNGVSVTKTITKQVYDARAATCTATTGSRASATNYQDLWWNQNESGWGLNITHQGNILFATLFTYGSNNQALWLVMSSGQRQADGSYLGDLYRTSGPPFNANPFTPINAGNLTLVGSMRLRFSNGETGTLEYSVSGVNVTKQITRQVFSSPAFVCTS